MIFKSFEKTDIVEGRTTKVASGFWPDGNTYWSSSFLEDDFWDLTNSQTPSTAFGASPYDVRKSLYYTNVFPNATYKNTYNDPYFSVTYGHVGGSGSFDYETGSIKVNPTKAIYNQYKNILLGNTDLDGRFTMTSGSGTSVNADDIFVINFSTYKTKDRIDEGVFEISFASPDGSKVYTFIDDSYYVGRSQSVYQLVSGSLGTRTAPTYNGIGLLYPNDGIVIFNAAKLNELLTLDAAFGANVNIAGNTVLSITSSNGTITSEPPSASFYTGSKSNAFGNGAGSQYVLGSSDARYNSYLNADLGNQNNTQIFLWSLKHSKKPIVVRKSEYVPSRHYFVRVKNRDYNYSNNPTYVYDGTEILSDGTVPSAGTIRNEDFYTDPKTYITTVGLYNETNELVAVAKLSRPAVKSFDNELLLKIRLDF
jgi:hypothetical protein